MQQQRQPALQSVQPSPKKKTGRRKWFFPLGIAGILFVCSSVLCCGSLFYIFSQEADDNGIYTTDTTTITGSKEETPSDFNSVNVTSNVESVYDENISYERAERITLNELVLGHEALDLLVQTSWSGDLNHPLPISSDDFEQAELDRIINHEREKLKKLTIPDEFAELFHGSDAVADIKSEMFSAREEYIDYMKAMGAAQKYIDEINNNALPADPDRITYHPDNNPDSPPSVTQKYSGSEDFSQREFNLYDIDIYNNVTIFERSNILGEAPAVGDNEWKEYYTTLRNMGIRLLMYHEMTHVLHRAYITLHVDDEHRTDKVAWIYADQTLVDVDDQYFWEWGGGSLKMENNLDVSQESQAEGISFEVLTNVYDMSDVQKEALWDHIHGRLDDARVHLNEIRNIAETNYPNFSPDALGGMLAEAFSDYPNLSDRGVLQKTARKLGSLAPYVGYLNAMRPEDTHKFWDALER